MPVAKLIAPTTKQEISKLRVAAYCRVSSNSADQRNSFATQEHVYTKYIAEKPEWELVDIFADEGLSGMKADNRPEFQRMLRMCELRQIDLILTKSVSRFARNVKEALNYTRKLKLLGVGVQFEEEGINTLAMADEMKKAGAFKEYAGEFWTAPETRPYMRVRYTYFDVLISCGMMRQAISEGQRLLELCESDDLGVRYQLMHLYVFMEDEMHALALHKQFDSYEETQMLLPLAVLYYKLNQFDKAADYIKRLAKANKDTKKFLRAAAHDELDDYIDELNPYGYQPFTMEELLDELMKSSYLFDSVPYFFAWASKVLATKPASKKSAGKPHLLN